MTKSFELSATRRLRVIAEIIKQVDHRCMAADGPVTPTLEEMNQSEISEIYALAKDDRGFLKNKKSVYAHPTVTEKHQS